jgi:hypothetical protein
MLKKMKVTSQMLLPPEFMPKPPAAPLPESVTIPEHLTYRQFGCREDFFREYVKGCSLPVIGRFGNFFTVEVGPEKEIFNVHISDLRTDRKNGET